MCACANRNARASRAMACWDVQWPASVQVHCRCTVQIANRQPTQQVLDSKRTHDRPGCQAHCSRQAHCIAGTRYRPTLPTGAGPQNLQPTGHPPGRYWRVITREPVNSQYTMGTCGWGYLVEKVHRGNGDGGTGHTMNTLEHHNMIRTPHGNMQV